MKDLLPYLGWFGIYLAVISLISVIFCIYDKIASKKAPKNRVPERSLFSLCFLGGAPAMLLCMLLIRHKTQHWQMKVIPVITVLQLIVLIGVTAVLALGII